MRRKSLSIRIRTLSLLGLIFFVMLSALSYFAFAERQEALAKAMADVRSSAEHIASDQGRVIEYARQLVTVLTQMQALGKFATSPGCREFLSQVLIGEPRLSNLSIATPNGDVRCNATATPVPVNLADRLHFMKALRSEQLVIGKAVVNKSSGKWTLPFSKAIRDDSGKVQAVLVVAVDLEWVDHELATARYPSGARLGLIDRDGTVLARHPDPENWIGKNAADTPFFATLLSHDGTGAADAPGFDGISRIQGFAHFAETAAGPIYLWIGVPKEAIVARVEREFGWTLFISFALLAICFGAVWIEGERLLLRPVSILAGAAKRLGAGDHNARSGLEHREDELGELARVFDEMAQALLASNEILRLNRSLRVLSSCNKALIHAENEQQLLREVCRLIVEAGNYRMAWVGYAEPDFKQSVRPVAQYGYDDDYLNKAQISWADTERGRGPTGTAIRTGQTQINQNFATNPELAPWRDDALRRGYRSSAALPLSDATGAFGALTIYSGEPEAFTSDEMQLLQELADDLAFGITNLRARIAHEENVTRLQRSMEATIEAFTTTLEMRDPYTAGHQRRVAALSTAISTELGLPDDEIHAIGLAAMVHDIGKIKVPAEILSKPSQLTEIEYLLVKQHVEAGYEILKKIDFPWPIAEFILQHHERIDGSGYPRGLGQSQIRLGAKIIAVADTIEAMASHRPYRPSVGIETALQLVAANRGKLYDAAVVDACIALFEQGRFVFPP